MSGQRLQLVVFDCDGTLVDSQHHIVAAMHAAFDRVGLERREAAAIRRGIGLPLPEMIAGLVRPPEARFRDALVQAYRDAFVAQRHQPGYLEPLFPGVVEALDALDARGVLMGIATGKGRRGLDAVLGHHGLLHRFVTRITADDGPGKPHPAMLEMAMSEAGVPPERTAMVGDTTFDLEMARNAAVTGIGVAWGYHPPAALEGAGASFVAADYPALLAHLLART